VLEFYAGTHSYEWNGVSVPGVTSVLKSAGILQGWGTQADLDRGTRVHEMVHAWFDNDLGHVPEWLQPYLVGVQNFVAETGFRATEWEHKVFSKKHGYAGQLDVRGKMRGQRLPVMVDFKTGQIARWTRYQLAAYTLGIPHLRIAVSLMPGLREGKNYDMKIYPVSTLAADLKVFLDALRWSRQLAAVQGA